ncbi:AraC family transcriptional regulator [Tenacibaculum sp. TC6]|uniref:AraC family transcriptional regulator n=1 Tax=Tenacibaculum sp. TC6 TaxID=3423223 RepID=UPI003D36C9E4
MKVKASNDVIGRINKALIYIDEHINQKILLEDVAKEAYFSPYHFHRLFSIVIGETLHSYILRKRIEKSAKLLLRKDNTSMVEIAESIGFINASAFSRSFKKFYGISPTDFKESATSKFSKICIEDSKKRPIKIKLEQYISNINKHLNFIEMNAKIEVKNIAAIQVAYLTHIGTAQKIAKVYEELIKWAYPKGLLTEDVKMATIYHDSPKITAPEKLRMSACILLTDEIKTEGNVGVRTIPGGKHIVASYEITLEEFQIAWESVFVWLSEKGFKVRGAEPFEIYHNDFNKHPEKKCIVDFYVPVE